MERILDAVVIKSLPTLKHVININTPKSFTDYECSLPESNGAGFLLIFFFFFSWRQIFTGIVVHQLFWATAMVPPRGSLCPYANCVGYSASGAAVLTLRVLTMETTFIVNIWGKIYEDRTFCKFPQVTVVSRCLHHLGYWNKSNNRPTC